MNIQHLFIKDFLCHSDSFIDFTLFSSALIIGKIENNDLYSNGVGKTSIFKAIEYVLFNQSDSTLEKVIRDDTERCQVVCDFTVSDQIYRLIRIRTKKGNSDLSLYQRTDLDGVNEEVYYSISNEPITSDKYWKDISGRRTADTEKDLSKLLKIGFKAFRSVVHFVQGDMSGLTTATPENRKRILKDALNLIVYSKLEKIAKEKHSILIKESDKLKVLIGSFADPDKAIVDLNSQLINIQQDLNDSTNDLKAQSVEVKQASDNISSLVNERTKLVNDFSALQAREQALTSERNKIEVSVKEYTTKKSNIIKLAKDLLADLKILEESQTTLSQLDFSLISSLSEQIISNKEIIAQQNLTIHNYTLRLNKLKIPMSSDSECEHCRQTISAEHKKICQSNINEEILSKQASIISSKKLVSELTQQNLSSQKTINDLNISKQSLYEIINSISSKKQEINDKKETHEEYKTLLAKFINQYEEKQLEVQQATLDLQNSSIAEANKILEQIEHEKRELSKLSNKLDSFNKKLSIISNNKAIIQHTLNQKIEDKQKKEQLSIQLKSLEDQLIVYPSVLQAFSSVGIPNLIIQNTLDDLQIESNNLLAQLKPGIQLAFSIEKTKADGEETDTLDINYIVNGKDRYYEQLSGAQKLAVSFSLKLGLSFLLQKMIGVDIKFLLLDEIDQSLDKAGVDAFVQIIKHFQNEFTILTITHNDRLKDKFSNAILVEQNISGVSTAKVVFSW